jgi:hypothetical protein
VERILRQTEQCRQIIKGLLNFARPQSRERSLVPLGEVVHETVYLMEKSLRVAGVKVDLETATAPLEIAGNRHELEQVFFNLLVNAVDAMPDGGTVTIRLGPGGPGEILASVADTGPGIQPAQRDEIFLPFFTTKDYGKGTGLGLSIVARIMHEHGGRIELDPAYAIRRPVPAELPAARPGADHQRERSRPAHPRVCPDRSDAGDPTRRSREHEPLHPDHPDQRGGPGSPRVQHQPPHGLAAGDPGPAAGRAALLGAADLRVPARKAAAVPRLEVELAAARTDLARLKLLQAEMDEMRGLQAQLLTILGIEAPASPDPDPGVRSLPDRFPGALPPGCGAIRRAGRRANCKPWRRWSCPRRRTPGRPRAMSRPSTARAPSPRESGRTSDWTSPDRRVHRSWPPPTASWPGSGKTPTWGTLLKSSTAWVT